MKLIRYNSPLSSLARIADFDDWFRSPFAGLPSLARFFNFGQPDGSDFGSLATDVHEDKENYYARFEVPGVKKEDVKIELNDRMLTVTVEKKEKRGDEESSYTSARSISVRVISKLPVRPLSNENWKAIAGAAPRSAAASARGFNAGRNWGFIERFS